MSAAPTAVPDLVQIRQVRRVDGFSRWAAASRKGVPFGVSLMFLPILGVKSTNPNFGVVNKRFQTNRQDIESFILPKLLYRFQSSFAQR